ncbi:amylosucrase [Alteromonas flava]|uniref:amylosucrase n=1 Tax=Alteromonas flava TaxID=2048003 RepID=UPI000C28DC31|nr:amylosucrase [Alteromonas flava]
MDLQLESQRTLQRVLSDLDLKQLTKAQQKTFVTRLEEEFTQLFTLLHEIYGHRYDFYFHIQALLKIMLTGYAERSRRLKNHDQKRLNDPQWYRSENMVGMALYVDLFAGDLSGVIRKIPYLKTLGISYLHLMPLYKSPEGDSDGGYAVSDYRTVNPQLGNVNDLEALSKALAEADISLVLDFVFNHTSDEHRWAQAAKTGDRDFQEFYYMFDDRTLPDQYERHLREIFPQVRRGNFTWNEESGKWVWTTFNNFQWDLNYSNPAVFNAIVGEMLFLANIGCEALRLDALAFIWKEMGTNCENQANAHRLIQAFNSCLRIVAPAVVFKSEAIVHPDEVNKYIAPEECQLSYNPLLMALIWNSLATRKTHLLTDSMRRSFTISSACSWVNYVRCHDDIGWTFDDNVAWQLGINADDHRYFLNQFYTGRFEGSFATGVAFAENPTNGDCRVCGSLASLAGLEKAIALGDQEHIEHAIARILLVHTVIFGIGGIPLLYSGDELGLLNDYSYQQVPSKQHDARWVQRIPVKDSDIARAKDSKSPESRIFKGLQKLVQLRKSLPILGEADTQILVTNNPHVFAFLRLNESSEKLLALHNFSEHTQRVDKKVLETIGHRKLQDLLQNVEYDYFDQDLVLAPYQVSWLRAQY